MISFVQTAREGSFAGAGKMLDITPVAVSRNVSRLEKQLGVRLFGRTTRKLSLTAEGASLLARCVTPLEELEQAFQASRDATDKPKGCVRVTSVSPFARGYLLPLLPEFYSRYPEIELDLELSERVTDLVIERFDVGIRVGQLRDTSFIARPLGPLKFVLCGSPEYFRKAGIPRSLEDLSLHQSLSIKLAGSSRILPWMVQSQTGISELSVSGLLRCNDFASLALACCAGLGLSQLPLIVALPALMAGKLKVVMPDVSPTGLQLYLHYPNRQLPARVRVFVDFVMERMRGHPDFDFNPSDFLAVDG